MKRDAQHIPILSRNYVSFSVSSALYGHVILRSITIVVEWCGRKEEGGRRRRAAKVQ